jgi:hypothetical protein
VSFQEDVKRAGELLKSGDLSGWELAELTARRTFTSDNPTIFKRERTEGRVSAKEWAAQVSAAGKRSWGQGSAQAYARCWRRYGAKRNPAWSFVEHMNAARDGSEASAEENVARRAASPQWGEGAITANQVQQAMTKLPLARQAELVHKVARANPAILRSAVRDPEVYEAISKERVRHVVEEADRGRGPTISREEYGRGMREARDSDGLLALYRAQEALAIAMRFSASTIAEDCSEKDVRNLRSSLPQDIDFLQGVLEAISSEKLRLVKTRS